MEILVLYKLSRPRAFQRVRTLPLSLPKVSQKRPFRQNIGTNTYANFGVLQILFTKNFV